MYYYVFFRGWGGVRWGWGCLGLVGWGDVCGNGTRPAYLHPHLPTIPKNCKREPVCATDSLHSGLRLETTRNTTMYHKFLENAALGLISFIIETIVEANASQITERNEANASKCFANAWQMLSQTEANAKQMLTHENRLPPPEIWGRGHPLIFSG